MSLASRFTALRDVSFSALSMRVRNNISEMPTAHDDDKATRTFLLPAFFLYLTALLITDISLFTIPYAFSDDYPALISALHHNLTSEVQSRVAGGRPTVGLLFYLAFSYVRSVSDLSAIRLGGIVTLAMLAWLLYWALLKAGWSPLRALPIPLIICTLPSLQIYATWAILALTLSAMVAAGVAAILVERAYDQLGTQPGRASVALLLAGAIGVWLLALTIHQSAAMVYWVFAAIFLLVRRRTTAQLVKRFLAFLGVAIIGMGLELLLVKHIYIWIYGQPDPLSRTTLAQPSDMLFKAAWFVAAPLSDSLNFHNIAFTIDNLVSNGEIALVMGAFITLGFFLYTGGSFLNMLIKGAVAFCLLPLAYVPNLIVAENWPSYRTQCALGGLLALYAALAVYGFAGKFGGKAQHTIAPTVLVIAAALGMLAASNTVTTEIVEPSYIELHVAVLQLEQQKASLATASAIYFIQSEPSDSAAPVVRYDEYGSPSAWQPWTPGAMTYLALEQVDPARVTLPVIVLPPDVKAPPGVVVIDMRILKDFANQPSP